jgi:hypothetical protein
MFNSFLLAVTLLNASASAPACDARAFGKPRDESVPVSVVRDSIVLEKRRALTAAERATLLASRADIGLRCAIELMVSFSGLNRLELQESSKVCLPMRVAPEGTLARRRWAGQDEVAVCTLTVARDSTTHALLQATLRVIAVGGPVDANGMKPLLEHDVTLDRFAGSRRWSVRSYTVGNPE